MAATGYVTYQCNCAPGASPPPPPRPLLAISIHAAVGLMPGTRLVDHVRKTEGPGVVRAGRGMSGLSRLVAARRPEEAVLAAPGRDVAVTTTVLALAALMMNELQRRWRAHRPGQPAASQVPDTAQSADLR